MVTFNTFFNVLSHLKHLHAYKTSLFLTPHTSFPLNNVEQVHGVHDWLQMLVGNSLWSHLFNCVRVNYLLPQAAYRHVRPEIFKVWKLYNCSFFSILENLRRSFCWQQLIQYNSKQIKLDVKVFIKKRMVFYKFYQIGCKIFILERFFWSLLFYMIKPEPLNISILNQN